jgi:hypothetical protein
MYLLLGTLGISWIANTFIWFTNGDLLLAAGDETGHNNCSGHLKIKNKEKQWIIEDPAAVVNTATNNINNHQSNFVMKRPGQALKQSNEPAL